MNSIRRPVVAGAFYPGSANALSQELKNLGIGAAVEKSLESSVGLIAPHAGYAYSGKTAAAAYSALAARGRPEWAIILGANHTGMGYPLSIATQGEWETPLGIAPIASEIAARLSVGEVEVAPEAFLREHSIEVQLPFLQYLFGPRIKFVPVCVTFSRLESLLEMGEAIANVAKETAGVVIASSDFTHYQPAGVAHQLDMGAIDRILALDAEGFYRDLIHKRLTICGGGAITALIECARSLGWKANLSSYSTSGDATGDRSSVVGYAGLTFFGGE